jgi:hypothetical protein
MTSDSRTRIDSVLRDLQSLGADIANHDLGYRVEKATFETGAATSRIDAIAAIASEPLPGDYSYFLSRCAGFVAMDFHNGYVIHTPEVVVRLFREAGAPRRLTTTRGDVPILAIAGDGGGNVFFLQLRPPHVVLRWDHERGGRAGAIPDTDVEPIAENFVSFLERVRDDWSHFLGADPASWTYIT